ncbi:hypothetical protein PATSB16_32210 [Pandoraea thiooxydans]|uniref:Polysaccharide biosynthesis protein n=1 Tax=Pandoraea thiooxydans TaxID=445709 RepID=A0A0G3EUL2_9BURK|nr:hypothetical protein [Pandoraea thiooxydans]AKJ69017.1 hypothetical protein ABW99_13180 [Pandoraea thiooxydans]APR96559.1 hypothetical protein PATSB16_32210 [Pandoraea thiooxydans]
MRRIYYFFAVLLSNLAGAAGFFFLTAKGYVNIPLPMLKGLISFFQLQPLFVTAAKLGVDNYVFATVHQPEQVFRWRKFYLTRVTPLAALLAAISALALLPIEISALLFISISLDVYSVVKIAESNAKKQYFVGLIATTLNIPLFFLGFYLLRGYDWSLTGVVMLFTFCGLIRALVVFNFSRVLSANSTESIAVPHHLLMVGLIFQILNFLLFRIDQLISTRFMSDEVALRKYLFFTKFVEMTASLFVVFGAIYFKDVARFIRIYKKTILLCVFPFFLSIYVGILAYAWLGHFRNIYLYPIPFAVAAGQVVIVNYLSYLLVSQGRWWPMNFAYLCGILTSLCCAILGGWIFMLPLGFATFVLVSWRHVDFGKL